MVTLNNQMTENEPTKRTIPLSLSPYQWVNLHGYFPITEEQWKQMMRLLAAYKPGLVTG